MTNLVAKPDESINKFQLAGKEVVVKALDDFLEIYVPHLSCTMPVAVLDLFYFTPDAVGEEKEGLVMVELYDPITPNTDDTVANAIYWPTGLTVVQGDEGRFDEEKCQFVSSVSRFS